MTTMKQWGGNKHCIIQNEDRGQWSNNVNYRKDCDFLCNKRGQLGWGAHKMISLSSLSTTLFKTLRFQCKCVITLSFFYLFNQLIKLNRNHLLTTNYQQINWTDLSSSIMLWYKNAWKPRRNWIVLTNDGRFLFQFLLRNSSTCQYWMPRDHSNLHFKLLKQDGHINTYIHKFIDVFNHCF